MSDKKQLLIPTETQAVPAKLVVGASRWKTQWNANEFPRDREIKPSLLPSLTIPDQSLSVKEIMRRFAQGLPLEGIRNPVYEDVEDLESDFFPDLEHMDLADRQAALEAVKAEVDAINDRIKNERENARKRAVNRSGDEIPFEETDEQNKYPKKTPPEAHENEPAQRTKKAGSGADGNK